MKGVFRIMEAMGVDGFAAAIGSAILVCAILIAIIENKEKSSSYTQWNNNAWQVNDTVFVLTSEGDTAKFQIKQ